MKGSAFDRVGTAEHLRAYKVDAGTIHYLRLVAQLAGFIANAKDDLRRGDFL